MKSTTAILLVALVGSAHAGFKDVLRRWGQAFEYMFERDEMEREEREEHAQKKLRAERDAKKASSEEWSQLTSVIMAGGMDTAWNGRNAATIISNGLQNTDMSLVTMQPATTGYKIAWTSLGPNQPNVNTTSGVSQYIMPAGQARVILPHPTNPNIVLVGMAFGGIWRSTNADSYNSSTKTYNTSWSPVAEWAASTSIAALVWDAGSPGTVAYAATGGLPVADWGIGGGILKSTDGGATWTVLKSTANAAEVDVWKCVNGLVSYKDATGKSILVAATSKGVRVSKDGGSTWISPTGDAQASTILSVAVANATNTLFFALGKASDGLRVYQSTDPAGNWTRTQSIVLTNDPVNLAPSRVKTVSAISASAVTWSAIDSKIGYFAVTNELLPQDTNGIGYSNTSGGVTLYVTQDRNANPAVWKRVQMDAKEHTLWVDGLLSGYGGHHLGLWVSPNDAKRILIGGTTVRDYAIDPATAKGVLTEQSNFTYRADGLASIHPDIYSIVSVPTKNSVWVGTDGGVSRIDSVHKLAKSNSQQTHVLAKDLVTSLVISSDVASDGRYGIGFQDNGTWERSASGTWTNLGGGDGYGYLYYTDETGKEVGKKPRQDLLGGVAITAKAANGTVGEMWWWAWDQTTGPYIKWTTLNATTPKELSLQWAAGEPRAFAANPKEPGTVFAAVDGTDHGVRLVRYSIQGTEADLSTVPATNIMTSYPTGTCGGTTYSMDVVGAGLDGTMPDEIDAIAFDPSNPSRAYIGYRRRKHSGRSTPYASIWKTENYKDANPVWTPIGCQETGLPNLRPLSIIVDPANPDVVLVGTVLGLYASVDGGNSWGKSLGNGQWDTYNVGPSNVEMGRMKILGRKLYLSTFGRGVWVGTLPDAPKVTLTTSPLDATDYANQTVVANPTDADGTIQRVEFWLNGSLVSTRTATPWSATLPQDLQRQGENTLTIVTYDSQGLKTSLNKTFQISKPLGAPWRQYLLLN